MITTNEYLIFNNKIHIYLTYTEINKFITYTYSYQIHTNISHTYIHTSTSFVIIVKLVYCTSCVYCIPFFRQGLTV